MRRVARCPRGALSRRKRVVVRSRSDDVLQLCAVVASRRHFHGRGARRPADERPVPSPDHVRHRRVSSPKLPVLRRPPGRRVRARVRGGRDARDRRRRRERGGAIRAPVRRRRRRRGGRPEQGQGEGGEERDSQGSQRVDTARGERRRAHARRGVDVLRETTGRRREAATRERERGDYESRSRRHGLGRLVGGGLGRVRDR